MIYLPIIKTEYESGFNLRNKSPHIVSFGKTFIGFVFTIDVPLITIHTQLTPHGISFTTSIGWNIAKPNKWLEKHLCKRIPMRHTTTNSIKGLDQTPVSWWKGWDK